MGIYWRVQCSNGEWMESPHGCLKYPNFCIPDDLLGPLTLYMLHNDWSEESVTLESDVHESPPHSLNVTQKALAAYSQALQAWEYPDSQNLLNLSHDVNIHNTRIKLCQMWSRLKYERRSSLESVKEAIKSMNQLATNIADEKGRPVVDIVNNLKANLAQIDPNYRKVLEEIQSQIDEIDSTAAKELDSD